MNLKSFTIQEVFKVALIVALSFFVYGCSSSSQNSLLGEYEGPLGCPPTGCVNGTPQPDGVYIQRDVNRDLQLVESDSSIEITGLCSASTYFENRIEVTNSPSNSPATFFAINMGSSALTPKCSMGKFHIYLNACTYKAAGRYTVNVKIVPLDNTLTPVDVVGNSFAVNFQRSLPALPAVCP